MTDDPEEVDEAAQATLRARLAAVEALALATALFGIAVIAWLSSQGFQGFGFSGTVYVALSFSVSGAMVGAVLGPSLIQASSLWEVVAVGIVGSVAWPFAYAVSIFVVLLLPALLIDGRVVADMVGGLSMALVPAFVFGLASSPFVLTTFSATWLRRGAPTV